MINQFYNEPKLPVIDSDDDVDGGNENFGQEGI